MQPNPEQQSPTPVPATSNATASSPPTLAPPQPDPAPSTTLPAETPTAQLGTTAAPTAEDGTTTTEWKLALGAVGTTAVALATTVITNHVHALTPSDIDAIKAFLYAIDGVVVAYVLGRSLRKLGTAG